VGATVALALGGLDSGSEGNAAEHESSRRHQSDEDQEGAARGHHHRPGWESDDLPDKSPDPILLSCS